VTLLRPFAPLGRDDGVEVEVTPEDAGWTYAGLRVVRVPAGSALRVESGCSEMFLLPLSGSVDASIAASDDQSKPEAEFHLVGRDSVFTRVTDFAYVGRDSVVVLSSEKGAEVALPSARCSTRLPAKYGPAEDVPVEIRGAGTATRQVTNFGAPGVWDHAERLICCELITPPGNWSSYPPHKHDITDPCPVVNEEIYYYRISGPDQAVPDRRGYGLHVTNTGPEHAAAGLAPLAEALIVRDGDVVVVPYGYHGPCAAASGYAMYYLNVLAGPGEERSMAFCDHPDHAWLRAAWESEDLDPRCPVTSATGRLSH
jgi:5-deoxy-glucuronate isomerase